MPPSDPTEDERYALDHWGDWILNAVARRHHDEHLLVPQSRTYEEIELTETAPGLFLKFAHTPETIDDVKALADCYGRLSEKEKWPESVESWLKSIQAMHGAVKEWEAAKKTGEFEGVVNVVNRRGLRRRQRWYDERTRLDFRLELDASGIPRLCARPISLLDALWVQLTLAVEGHENLQRCAVCTTWFPVEEGRSDKKFCSRACQMRAFRKKHKGVE